MLSLKFASPMLTALFLLNEAAVAEMRDFKSSTGTVLTAQLVKAKGQTIFLKDKDGKQRQVELKNFSKDDQTYILKWIAEDPTAVEYNWICKIEEKLQESFKSRGYYESQGVQRKAFEVQVTNGCRNALSGVTLEYVVFLLDKVDGEGSYFYDATAPRVVFKSAAVALPSLAYNTTHKFTTKSYYLHSVRSALNRNRAKDRLLGVWIRFYRGETMVGEWKSQSTPRCEWPLKDRLELEDPKPTEDKKPPFMQPDSQPEKISTPQPDPADEAPAPAPTETPATPKTSESSDPKPSSQPSNEDDDATLLKIFELDEADKE